MSETSKSEASVLPQGPGRTENGRLRATKLLGHGDRGRLVHRRHGIPQCTDHAAGHDSPARRIVAHGCPHAFADVIGFWIAPVLTAHWVDEMHRYMPFVIITGVFPASPLPVRSRSTLLRRPQRFALVALVAVVAAPGDLRTCRRSQRHRLATTRVAVRARDAAEPRYSPPDISSPACWACWRASSRITSSASSRS